MIRWFLRYGGSAGYYKAVRSEVGRLGSGSRRDERGTHPSFQRGPKELGSWSYYFARRSPSLQPFLQAMWN